MVYFLTQCPISATKIAPKSCNKCTHFFLFNQDKMKKCVFFCTKNAHNRSHTYKIL